MSDEQTRCEWGGCENEATHEHVRPDGSKAYCDRHVCRFCQPLKRP